ncbi:MAG: hypothetical protein ABI680_00550 [Chthoniobacteraceae bacterium]
MNLSDDVISRRTERFARGTAAVAGLAALGLLWIDRGDFSLVYRFVVFALLAPALGCLIFTLIHRMTGGQWAIGLRPFLLAGVSLLPWIWLFVLPIPLLPHSLSRHAPALASAAHGYESLPMVMGRAVIYAAIFFALRWVVAGDAGRDDLPTGNRRPWVGPVGLLVLVFTLTLLADDWIASVDPGWHSTGFALVWMTGQAVAGLSLALLAGLASGAPPVSAAGSEERPVGIDWGNLLMATLLTWSYVAFAQYLIIWAGNLPAETSWFMRRTEGAWVWVPPGLAIFGLLVPFLLLLSRRFKSRTWGLAVVAVMLLLSQVLYIGWLILPAAGKLSPAGWALVLALFVAGAAVFMDRYCATARKLRRQTT